MELGSQAIYEDVYRGRHSFIHHLSYMRLAKVQLALWALDQARVSLENKSVFDYGFGAGTLLFKLPRSCAISGVELDPVTVAEVARRLVATGRKADLQPIDISNWQSHPLLTKTYDLFICSHVLEHLPDPPSFLRHCSRCLTPDGLFLGLVPLNERRPNPHHLHAPDKCIIRQWAAEAGMDLVFYAEGDPWIYWIQPLYTFDSGLPHKLAQVCSLLLGTASALAGPHAWHAMGKLFAAITRSKLTQAVFLLGRPA